MPAPTYYFPPDHTAARGTSFTPWASGLLIPEWSNIEAWGFFGNSLISTVVSGGVPIDGISASASDTQSGAWMVEYTGDLLNLESNGVLVAYALPSGIYTGCAFSSGQSKTYVISSEGDVFVPSGTGVVEVSPAFGAAPTWGLVASGSSLFTILGGSNEIGVLTLSTSGHGTSGTITPPMSTPTCLTASPSYGLAAGGLSYPVIVSGYTDVVMDLVGPYMVAVSPSANTVDFYIDDQEVWTRASSTSGTGHPTFAAWSPNGLNIFVTDPTSGAVEIFSYADSAISPSTTLSVAGAGSIAIESQSNNVLVVAEGHNQVVPINLTGATWTVASGIPFDGAASVCMVDVGEAAVGYTSGIAFLVLSNQQWSQSSAVTLPYTPTDIFADPYGFLYAVGTQGGSGYLSIFSNDKLLQTVSWAGAASGVTAEQGQIVVSDPSISSVRVFGSTGTEYALQNTFEGPSGVASVAMGGLTLFSAGSGQTYMWQWTAPYQLSRLPSGVVGIYEGGSWKSTTLGIGEWPEALAFDASGNLWVATLQNALYSISSAGAVLASGGIPTYSGQEQSAPLGISWLEWFNGQLYAATSMPGTFIQAVCGTLELIPTPPPPPPGPPGTQPPVGPPPPPPPPPVSGTTVVYYTTPGAWRATVPANAVSGDFEGWAGAGAGGDSSQGGGGGGAGAMYAAVFGVPVTPGQVFTGNIGAAGISTGNQTQSGSGGNTSIVNPGGSEIVLAIGGPGGFSNGAGATAAPAASGVGSTIFTGGPGGSATDGWPGGGGSSATPTASGAPGQTPGASGPAGAGGSAPGAGAGGASPTESGQVANGNPGQNNSNGGGGGSGGGGPSTAATWNPNDSAPAIQFSTDDLTITLPAASANDTDNVVRGTVSASSGLKYFQAIFNGGTNGMIGLCNAQNPLVETTYTGSIAMGGNNTSIGINPGFGIYSQGNHANAGSMNPADRIAIAYNLNTMLFWWKNLTQNTQWYPSGDPGSATGGQDISFIALPIFPGCSLYDPGGSYSAVFAQASFQGTVPAGFSALSAGSALQGSAGAGGSPGGAGGGNNSSTSSAGGAAAPGQIRVTWHVSGSAPPPPPPSQIPMPSTPPIQASSAGFSTLLFEDDFTYANTTFIDFTRAGTDRSKTWHDGEPWGAPNSADSTAYSVGNSILTMTSVSADSQPQICTSIGDITTDHYWLYGYMHAAISCSNWSTFALYDQNHAFGMAPPWLEIDVVETDSAQSNSIVCVLNSDGLNGPSFGGPTNIRNSPTTASVNGTVPYQFHIYGVLWTASTVTWFVDNVQVLSTANNFGAPPDPCFISFGLIAGGINGGPSVPPVTMLIDWAQVWGTAAFYVSATGSDSNPGTLSEPFATLAKAQSAMEGSSTKTTYVRGGNYSLSSTLSLTTADNGTTYAYYQPDGPNSAVFDGGNSLQFFVAVGGNNITFNGLKFQNGNPTECTAISINSINGAIVENCEFSNTSGNDPSGNKEAVSISDGSQNCIVRHNYFHDQQGIGVAVWHYGSSAPATSNILVDSNVLIRCATGITDDGVLYSNSHGAGASMMSGITFSNNLILDYGSSSQSGVNAIYLDDRSSNVTVTGNVVGPPVGTNDFGAGANPNCSEMVMINSDSYVDPSYATSTGNNTITGNIFDIGSFTTYNFGMNGHAETFKNNIVVRKYTGNISGQAGFGAGTLFSGESSLGGSCTVDNNIYYNYAGGQASPTFSGISNPEASPLVTDPLFVPGTNTYELTSTSPAYGSYVKFPAIFGGWGPPGFVVPADVNVNHSNA